MQHSQVQEPRGARAELGLPTKATSLAQEETSQFQDSHPSNPGGLVTRRICKISFGNNGERRAVTGGWGERRLRCSERRPGQANPTVTSISSSCLRLVRYHLSDWQFSSPRNIGDEMVIHQVLVAPKTTQGFSYEISLSVHGETPIGGYISASNQISKDI